MTDWIRPLACGLAIYLDRQLKTQPSPRETGIVDVLFSHSTKNVYQRYIVLCDTCICQNIVWTYITEEIYRKHNNWWYITKKEISDRKHYINSIRILWKNRETRKEWCVNTRLFTPFVCFMTCVKISLFNSLCCWNMIVLISCL